MPKVMFSLDRHGRVERVGLEHHGDVAVLRLDRIDQPVADADLARGHGLEPGDHGQQGGLAAAGGADQRDELARAGLEVDALEHLDDAVALAQVADGQDDMSHPKPHASGISADRERWLAPPPQVGSEVPRSALT